MASSTQKQLARRNVIVNSTIREVLDERLQRNLFVPFWAQKWVLNSLDESLLNSWKGNYKCQVQQVQDQLNIYPFYR